MQLIMKKLKIKVGLNIENFTMLVAWRQKVSMIYATV